MAAPDRRAGVDRDREAVTADPTRLRIDHSTDGDVTLLEPRGVLDLGTYPHLRDTLIKSAMEQPRAVVVDLDSLRIPTEATLSVFATVWMQVSEWPAVPIVLVASNPDDREWLRRQAIANVVPVLATVREARESLDDPPPRRRAALELPCSPASAALARRFVSETCQRWECAETLPAATTVASELVENAVRHARSEPKLSLELRSGTLAVAVYDDDPAPAQLVRTGRVQSRHLGLRLVANLARAWSCGPTWSGGKVVWAVLRIMSRIG
ncbi:MAG TPA: ATP-binding protein [Actinophytocola sp.]|uniref:ATP-binding protein n=1 Tax=Actinophytocola sp. TaxID=1872138 RepID=UPI002DDCC9FA|nr:ATP-binding protein [Actinophytocola sp.]HEV2778898.1 ATP-binding protein [Actinophytocola sp.]